MKLDLQWVNRPPIDLGMIKRNWKAINESPLKRAGLLVRTVMRGSIRRVKPAGKPSKPGTPPRSRDTRGRFKWIVSVPYDEHGVGTDTAVVIGHVTFRPAKGKENVQSIHEWGRRVSRRVFQKRQRKAFTRNQARAARRLYLSGRLKSKKTPSTMQSVKYPERKFAWPALKKVAYKILPLWRNSFNSSTVGGK